MAAEPLPFSFGALSSWELEAWYEDLQEVLSSDENGRAYVSPPGNEENQKPSPHLTLPLWRGWLRSQDQQRSQAPSRALAL
uniref:Uncharacterized protein n=1 Tax=Pipistrellus kuhlii TaxID=59472 RepID=A0A7J7ZJ17_PIPKU|nr:hypothetical protein mPipKuh1_009466 [Pipistrellus kuhlii]